MNSEDQCFLKLDGIEKSFSTVKVLEGVSFSLKYGEVLGIVGENGAGKSTLMNIIGGIIPKDAGKMYIMGKDYEPKNPIEAKKNGIAFIHQELNLFSNLTVMQNIFIEEMPTKGILKIVDKKVMRNIAESAIKRLGEEINVDSIVGGLNMGRRQMVEIAKALTKDAKVIIFDEPTTSLSNKEKEKLFKAIKDLSKSGVSIIYISHVLDDVFMLCDEILVLRDGKTIRQDKKELFTKEKVISMMVGRELNKLFPYVERISGKIKYEVKNLNQGKTLKNINLSLKEKEIVGMFGLMGAGRSELARALFGVDKFDSGELFIDNKKMADPDPEKCIENGMAFITENRREEGLLMPKIVKDNIVLASLKKLKGNFHSIDKGKENNASDKIINDLKIKTFDKNHQIVSNLSGGNQQKVVIGKWLLMEPKIFILDEPTRGIDVGAKYEIYTIINSLAEKGSSIFFISSEMEELMGICDRIIVMSKGEITGELFRNEFNQQKLLKMAIGGEA